MNDSQKEETGVKIGSPWDKGLETNSDLMVMASPFPSLMNTVEGLLSPKW